MYIVLFKIPLPCLRTSSTKFNFNMLNNTLSISLSRTCAVFPCINIKFYQSLYSWQGLMKDSEKRAWEDLWSRSPYPYRKARAFVLFVQRPTSFYMCWTWFTKFIELPLLLEERINNRFIPLKFLLGAFYHSWTVLLYHILLFSYSCSQMSLG